jgi:hypothetical protein
MDREKGEEEKGTQDVAAPVSPRRRLYEPEASASVVT